MKIMLQMRELKFVNMKGWTQTSWQLLGQGAGWRAESPDPMGFKKKYLFSFGCTRSLLLPWAFSSRSEWGLLSSCYGQASRCGDFSCCGATSAQVLTAQVSVAVAHRLSGPKTHGIFPDQGSNLCPLHCPVDS